MVKNHRSEKAVSEVLSYMLTFIITSVVVVATILTTNTVVDSRAKVAAGLQAQIIANQVADGLLSTVLLKQEFPDAIYSNTIDIPYQLASSSLYGLGRPYYIEASGTRVYVNSTDGQIIENSTSYNIGELCSGISGKVYSGSGKLKLECLKNDFLYKFDFGMNFQPTEPGYIKVSDLCTKSSWDLNNKSGGGYKYRTMITVANPTSSALINYPVLIQLNPKNFNYDLAKPDGSDIRFLNKTQAVVLPYWIETWNPRETSASRIWVKFDSLPALGDKNGTNFYMYYGKDTPVSNPVCNNGMQTFLFFDNFSGSNLDSNKWVSYPNGVGISIVDGCLKLNGSYAVRSKTQFGPLSYVVEAKVRAVGESEGEASMFVGNDGNPPCTKGYMLSSGYETLQKYFAILENSIPNEFKNIAMDKNNWYRLTYTVNGTTSFICRYNYTYFALDSNPNDINDKASIVHDGSSSTTPTTGYFGLCNTISGAVSYCDWIFVHPYAASASGKYVNNTIPIAYVGASSSINYYWDDISIVNSSKINDAVNNIGTDFVYSNQPAMFNITGVEAGTQYMITFSMFGYYDSLSDAIAGSNKTIDNVKVTVYDGASNIGVLDGLMVNAGSREKFSLLVKTPAITSGTLAITFSDPVTDHYWNACMLTIERGGMKIKIAGG